MNYIQVVLMLHISMPNVILIHQAFDQYNTNYSIQHDYMDITNKPADLTAYANMIRFQHDP